MPFSRICLFLIGALLGCKFWMQTFRLTSILFQKQLKDMKFTCRNSPNHLPISYVELQSNVVAAESTPEPPPQGAHSYRLSDYPPPDPTNNCLSYPFLFHSPIWRKQFEDVQECHSRNYRNKPSSVVEVEKSSNEYTSGRILYSLGQNTPRRIIPFEMACRGFMAVTCVSVFPIRMWKYLLHRTPTNL